MSFDPLSRMTPRERKALARLSQETGFPAEALAAEMAAAYLRLALDAPQALPARPILGIVRRAGETRR
uniref:hypothetical protein n=1 Tax=Ruegeria arenilitoris TaxID=1173585 RepID=UPI00147CEF17|nr:hypothetical protein [Ruegeria arenilitoris]